MSEPEAIAVATQYIELLNELGKIADLFPVLRDEEISHVVMMQLQSAYQHARTIGKLDHTQALIMVGGVARVFEAGVETRAKENDAKAALDAEAQIDKCRAVGANAETLEKTFKECFGRDYVPPEARK